MPTLMPSDTAAALGPNAENCNSRSLLLDRFVYVHPTMDEARKLHFAQVCADSFPTISATLERWRRTVNDPKATLQDKQKAAAFLKDTEGLAKRTTATGVAEPIKVLASRQQFLSGLSPTSLYAQLQSRLMVNMAGGVMENVGLCLDRFGLPYIPGSAVKGCARRAATQALLEAESSEAKADLLFKLCLVFGWGDTDWKAGRKRKRVNGREVETEPLSDFWWTMASETENRAEDDLRRSETWQQVAVPVAKRLLDQLRMHKREHPDEPWHDLPSFAGSVSFLPAYPVDLGKTGKVDGLPLEVPPLGKLELDVVTCHHRDYYAGKLPIATDTEEPVPVVFPAVAPGHVFAFGVAPFRATDTSLVQHARTWLATGLQTFGIGAKTNAGYGWFDCSETIHNTVERTLLDRAER